MQTAFCELLHVHWSEIFLWIVANESTQSKKTENFRSYELALSWKCRWVTSRWWTATVTVKVLEDSNDFSSLFALFYPCFIDLLLVIERYFQMQNTNLPEPIECDRKVIKEHQKQGCLDHDPFRMLYCPAIVAAQILCHRGRGRSWVSCQLSSAMMGIPPKCWRSSNTSSSSFLLLTPGAPRLATIFKEASIWHRISAFEWNVARSHCLL